MPEVSESNLNDKLRTVIETVDIANALTDPLTDSIDNLLQLTADELGSEEASVLVRDGDKGDLRFLTAIGQVADQLINLKVPAGKGIAGFVFSSGQPMTIADAESENSFYAEVDRSTGFTTQMILATPLRYNGEIIGVLEYVNRIGEPPFDNFTPEEMDKAAFFADVIATLVNAYESARIFRDLSEMMLADDDKAEFAEVREWLGYLRDGTEHKEMIDLAVLVREIASRGDAERRMCREVLESILRFSDSQTETSFLSL
jgi:signal transduction protein with GAF and PtsI domain